jgi:hypothetical protein
MQFIISTWRDYWAVYGITYIFRNVDWILTVPLMCLFYLILKLLVLILLNVAINRLSAVMLVTGYFGEAIFTDQSGVMEQFQMLLIL